MTAFKNDGLATVLRADELPKHRELPDGYRTTMGKVIAKGGPWKCRDCGTASILYWKCSACGKDLTKLG